VYLCMDVYIHMYMHTHAHIEIRHTNTYFKGGKADTETERDEVNV
jgi:hypothetical protein